MIDNKPSPSHDYHNSVQALTLIIDAKKRGLAKLVATGMSNLDELEKRYVTIDQMKKKPNRMLKR